MRCVFGDSATSQQTTSAGATSAGSFSGNVVISPSTIRPFIHENNPAGHQIPFPLSSIAIVTKSPGANSPGVDWSMIGSYTAQCACSKHDEVRCRETHEMSDDVDQLDAAIIVPGKLLRVREKGKDGDVTFASLYSRPTTIMQAGASRDPHMKFLSKELVFVLSVYNGWAYVLCEGTLGYIRIWEKGKRFKVIS